jgi:hypothetical protein
MILLYDDSFFPTDMDGNNQTTITEFLLLGLWKGRAGRGSLWAVFGDVKNITGHHNRELSHHFGHQL